jgi:hypothetical protein
MHTYRLKKAKISYRNMIQSLTRHCAGDDAFNHSLSLSLVKGPCLPHSYRTIAIQNRSAYGQPATFVQAHRHTQQVSLRTDGFTYTGSSPLFNKSAY